MTLAWGLLFKLMPAGDRGAVAGLATTTKGIGLVIGPLLAGACIDLLRGPLGETGGYQALWPILGIPILLVVPLVWSLMRAESAADRLARERQAEAPDGCRRRRRRRSGRPAGAVARARRSPRQRTRRATPVRGTSRGARARRCRGCGSCAS